MRQPNQALAGYLNAAGWRPAQLATAINRLLGPGYTNRSTVSEWLHAGRIPREPLPAITASLLAEATGKEVTVSDLWPGAPLTPVWAVPSDAGLVHLVHHPNPALAVAHDWIRHYDQRTGRDRRRFIPVPPNTLPMVKADTEHLSSPSGDASLGAVARAVATQLPRLPADSASLRFAHRQIITIARTLIDLPENKDLASALGVTLRTAGNVAYSLGNPGASQRYHASSTIALG